MTQQEILNRLLAHDEQALALLQSAYGPLLTKLAANIAGADEAPACVNEALLRAWNAIPPEKPLHLQAYLCKLVRNVAFNHYRAETAQKRGGTAICAPLEELSELVGGDNDPADAYERKAVVEAISHFLTLLSRRDRQIFLARYFYAMRIHEIAEKLQLREGTVKSVLHRTREQLRSYLKKEDLL